MKPSTKDKIKGEKDEIKGKVKSTPLKRHAVSALVGSTGPTDGKCRPETSLGRPL